MKGTSTKPFGDLTPKPLQRGTALLIVLSVLAILSVLVLGFVTSMVTEATSSNAVEMSYRTKMVAHGALSHSIELLPRPGDEINAIPPGNVRYAPNQ